MTARDLALRLVVLFAQLIIVSAALALTVLRSLATELADEIAASRRTLPGGNITMQPKNIKLWDSTSNLRAANAKLAAIVGGTAQARGELSDARQLAMPRRMS
jgi:hypothetical protein